MNLRSTRNGRTGLLAWGKRGTGYHEVFCPIQKSFDDYSMYCKSSYARKLIVQRQTVTMSLYPGAANMRNRAGVECSSNRTLGPSGRCGEEASVATELFVAAQSYQGCLRLEQSDR